jgi:hypothetical protein
VRLVNNLDWTAGSRAIDFLRDIGKHYRVGTMLKKDAVASRLSSDAGISYTEFSYQILQGFDYLELFRLYDCRCRPAAATSGATSRAAPTSSTASRASTCTRSARRSSRTPTAPKFGKSEATPSGSTPRCAVRIASTSSGSTPTTTT